MEAVYTKWGRQLHSKYILAEYPRPSLVRENYTNLNGFWEYAFTEGTEPPSVWDGRILVPFSPETPLSGVGRVLEPGETLWYHCSFAVPRRPGVPEDRRLLLHFGAVDQFAVIYVNRRKAGSHQGGYLPFSLDVTRYLQEGTNDLLVAVRDRTDRSGYARGLQSLEAREGFHRPLGGIWQTVWLEEVPSDYIEDVDIRPDPEGGAVSIRVSAASDLPVEVRIGVPGIYRDEEIPYVREDCGRAIGVANQTIYLPLSLVKKWTCDEPWLYYCVLSMGEDRLVTYFALRRISVGADAKGCPRLLLNGEAVFHRGVRDAGFWPDGGYTPPADQAILFDLKEMKRLGFNAVRKLEKIESDRWYYHCDRLGLLVWQDIVSGGDAGLPDRLRQTRSILGRIRLPFRDRLSELEEGRSGRQRGNHQIFIEEMEAEIRSLKKHPSIVTWVLFEEGRGRFDSRVMTERLKELDLDRLVDSSSGWMDMGAGDIRSIGLQGEGPLARPVSESGRPTVIASYGSIEFLPGEGLGEGEALSPLTPDRSSIENKLGKIKRRLESMVAGGLCGAMFAEWADMEGQHHGIYTADRGIQKFREEELP